MLAKNEEISESDPRQSRENAYAFQTLDVNYKPVYKNWKLLHRLLPLFILVGYH